MTKDLVVKIFDERQSAVANILKFKSVRKMIYDRSRMTKSEIRKIFSYQEKEEDLDAMGGEDGIVKMRVLTDSAVDMINECFSSFKDGDNCDYISKKIMSSLEYEEEGIVLHKALFSQYILDGGFDIISESLMEIRRINGLIKACLRESKKDREAADIYRSWDTPSELPDEIASSIIRFSRLEVFEDMEKTPNELRKIVMDFSKSLTMFKRYKGEVVVESLPLAYHQSKKYSGDTDDLRQEGNIGLMRAAEKFYHRRGFLFQTYAIHWVKQGIMRALNEQINIVKYPAHIQERYSAVKKARERLQASGLDGTNVEIASELGIPIESVHDILGLVKESISSSITISGEDGGATLEDFISDDSFAPDREIHRNTMNKLIGDALSSLTTRESSVIKMRYGIGGDKMTLEIIGERFSITRERVRQIEQKAVDKLQQQEISRNLLKDYL